MARFLSVALAAVLSGAVAVSGFATPPASLGSGVVPSATTASSSSALKYGYNDLYVDEYYDDGYGYGRGYRTGRLSDMGKRSGYRYDNYDRGYNDYNSYGYGNRGYDNRRYNRSTPNGEYNDPYNSYGVDNSVRTGRLSDQGKYYSNSNYYDTRGRGGNGYYDRYGRWRQDDYYGGAYNNNSSRRVADMNRQIGPGRSMRLSDQGKRDYYGDDYYGGRGGSMRLSDQGKYYGGRDNYYGGGYNNRRNYLPPSAGSFGSNIYDSHYRGSMSNTYKPLFGSRGGSSEDRYSRDGYSRYGRGGYYNSYNGPYAPSSYGVMDD